VRLARKISGTPTSFKDWGCGRVSQEESPPGFSTAAVLLILIAYRPPVLNEVKPRGALSEKSALSRQNFKRKPKAKFGKIFRII
jgi:hypothetical protein